MAKTETPSVESAENVEIKKLLAEAEKLVAEIVQQNEANEKLAIENDGLRKELNEFTKEGGISQKMSIAIEDLTAQLKLKDQEFKKYQGFVKAEQDETVSEILPAEQTRVILYKDHKLAAEADAKAIAKAIGEPLESVSVKLAAAVNANPHIRHNVSGEDVYNVYGNALWRYLGVEFQPPVV